MQQFKPFEEQTLPEKLRIRAHIRRNATNRKSVAENAPDRLSDLLEEAANRIDELEFLINKNLPN
jgi:hypothetical protein